MMIGMNAQVHPRSEARRGARQLARRQGTDWRRRLRHAVELPAASGGLQDRAGARCRLHGRAEAGGDGAAQRVHARRGRARDRPARRRPQHRLGSGPRRRRSDRRRIPMSTWSASPARCRPAAASRRVAGDGIKKVCLELGGKSAFVVLDDAPFDKAIPAGVNNCMQNSGQTCSAWTRMLVPRARHDEAVELAKAQLAKLTLGDPFDANTRLGPLASARSARQRARLHRAGQEGRRDAGRRRRPAVELAEGLLRRADDLRERRQQDGDRAGRDLRAGAGDHSLRHARPTAVRDRQRFDLRPGRRRVGGDATSARSPSRDSCAPGRWTSTAAASTCWRRSAATRSRASAARSVRWRSRNSSS